MSSMMFSRLLNPGPRSQLKIGAISGLLAMGLYWAKEPEMAVETSEVISFSKAVPLGRTIRESDLDGAEVPASVADDYVLDNEANRELICGRVARIALEEGTRLVPSMLPGGVSGDVSRDLPAGHRGVPLSVEDVPANTDRGMRVDVFDGRRRVARGVMVLSLEPFTVAVPVGEMEPFLDLGEVNVALRPDTDAGEVPEPKRPAPPAPKAPAKREKPQPVAVQPSRTILNQR